MIRFARVPSLALCVGVLATGLGAAARQAPPPAPLGTLSLPAGFRAEVFAEKVDNARSMALGPQGTVFVGSQYVGKVRATTTSLIHTCTARSRAG